ncbi:hypothetical protein, partial [Shewanella algae]|uniref:hypothetical protein n=1 Tax=Shewanella algae TaxID=38313 RepID=UPI00313BA512
LRVTLGSRFELKGRKAVRPRDQHVSEAEVDRSLKHDLVAVCIAMNPLHRFGSDGIQELVRVIDAPASRIGLIR